MKRWLHVVLHCLVAFSLLQFFVECLDVEWLKNNPREAFEKSSQLNYFIEEQEQISVVGVTEVEGSVAIHCAVERKKDLETPFKSVEFSVINLKNFNDKEYKLYLDVPLAEQAPFVATLKKAFIINDEFIISKSELLLRSKISQSSYRNINTEYSYISSASAVQTTKVTRVKGPQRILWMRSIFNDTTPAVGWPTNSEVAWNSIRMLDKYFRQYSYEQSWVDFSGCNVTQVYTLSFNKSAISSSADPIRVESLAKARIDGYIESEYDFLIVSFPTVEAYFWAGIAVVFGRFTWINAYSPNEILDYVLLHELGHNVGLGHANSWTSSEVPKVSFGGNGATKAYGDAFDNMGGGDVVYHWNIIKKQKIGWVNETSMRNISRTFSDFIYLHAFDQEINLGKQIAIYIPWNIVAKPNINFYLTYRSRSIRSTRMSTGAIEVHAGYKFYRAIETYETNDTHLIDTTPNSSAGIDDAMITLGQMYTENSGYPSMVISAVSTKCNPNLLNSNACILKGYLHFGSPIVSNQYSIRIIPQDIDLYDSSYSIATHTNVRFIAEISQRDNSQPVLHFFEFGSRDAFAAQSHFGTFRTTSTTNLNITFTANNMKGYSQSSNLELRIVSGKNYGGAWCDGPFNHNNDFKSFRPIVDNGVAKELHWVVNEDVWGSAYQVRQVYFYFPLNTTSGLYTFHTIAVDTNKVVGISAYKYMYMNRLENSLQLESDNNGTIRMRYIAPTNGTFLHELVSISNRTLTKMGPQQNTASYQLLSPYEIYINGTGNVNILHTYTVTNHTIMEMEIKTNQLGLGGHYVSLQQMLQHDTSLYIQLLPCRRKCIYSNTSTITSTYAKTSLLDTYSVVSIPLHKEYLRDRDEYKSLYISFTNANEGEMNVKRIRFYESRSILSSVCPDAAVRNSVIDYAAQGLQYQWRYQSKTNSSLRGDWQTTGTVNEGPMIRGVMINDTIDVSLAITSLTTGLTIWNQTVTMKYTLPKSDTDSFVVYSSPRISVVPRRSSMTLPRNSTRAIFKSAGSSVPVIARNSTTNIISRSSNITPRTSSITPRTSPITPRISPITPRTSPRVLSAAASKSVLLHLMMVGLCCFLI